MQGGVPRKGPKACEFRIAAQLAMLLELHCSDLWRYTHLPLGEKRDPNTARKLKLMGVVAGWPDYIFVGPGKVFFLELKRGPKVKASSAQSAIAAHLMACGFGYGMTSELRDAVGMLQQIGVLPTTIHVQ